MGEVERRRVEVRKLEEVGRSLESSPTQPLAQMAIEAGPSMSGGGAGQKETPADSGRQGSQEGVLKGQKIKETPEVQTSDNGSQQDLPVPEEHWAPNT